MQISNNHLKFDDFELWAKNWLSIHPTVSSELVRIEDSDPSCVRLDVFSKQSAGRIILRSDGVCDVEIIDGDTDVQLLYQHFPAITSDDLKIKFKEFTAYFSESLN
jgi:hypothetical protein